MVAKDLKELERILRYIDTAGEEKVRKVFDKLVAEGIANKVSEAEMAYILLIAWSEKAGKAKLVYYHEYGLTPDAILRACSLFHGAYPTRICYAIYRMRSTGARFMDIFIKPTPEYKPSSEVYHLVVGEDTEGNLVTEGDRKLIEKLWKEFCK